MLHVLDLEKSFGAHRVLQGTSFEVHSGETLGLIGGNGAGKSTIINIISGLLPKDGGSVEFSCADDSAETRGCLGLAMQEIAVYPTLSSEENLLFFGRVQGLKGQVLKQRVAAVIGQTGLDACAATTASELSGGWQRRLNLAIALVHAPRLLLLDEPSAGLDVEARLLIARLIRNLSSQGVGVLLTTHMLDEAEQICDQFAILAEGRIAAQGTLDELRRLVPAAELAFIECDDEAALLRSAIQQGIGLRHYGGRVTLLLPERTTIPELAARLGKIGLRSVSLQAVGLLHIYLEVSGSDQAM